MDTLLRVVDLKTRFVTKAGEVRPVDGVSFSIRPNETLGIVGESGCGKTVTSLSMMRLIREPGDICGGQILLGDQDLVQASEYDMQKIRGKRIAMIFQEPMTAFNPVMTVGAQITEQMLAHQKISQHEALEKAIDLLNLVGIPSAKQRVKDYPHQLSGGMRQRAMIAMALSCDPDLLIADEPTTALDVTIQAQILGLLQDLQEKFGMAIQFITHDLGVISEIADEVMVMYAGKVVEMAKSSELFSHPRHPYTVGLFQSIPKIDEKKKRLSTIPGTVPTLFELPAGCRFQNRCTFATEKCRESEPELLERDGRHLACHYPID